MKQLTNGHQGVRKFYFACFGYASRKRLGTGVLKDFEIQMPL